MMQAGNEGGEDKKGDKIYPETDKLQLSVSDMSSDSFKKTWLTLKELHDKELQHLQAKLTSLRKEQLVDVRTGSAAKIKELMEQQKVLHDTIQALRDQLRSKTCERCTSNETYKSTVQQEFYALQHENRKLIAELTAERDKLREENKMLSAKLKLCQQKFSPSEGDDDFDFVPCTQATASVFTAKEPKEGNNVYQPMKFLEQLIGTEERKSGREREEQQSPQLPLIFDSPDLFDIAETPLGKPASDTTSKHTTEGSDSQKSSIIFPSIYTESTQGGREFKTVSNLSEDKLGQAKKKETFTRKTSTFTQMGIPWSFSGTTEEQNPEIQVVSETSEENMPQNPSSPVFFTMRKERHSSKVFPLDYTRRKRSLGIPRYNIGLSEKDGSYKIPSSEQGTLRKNTNESAGASGYGADKPPDDNQSSILGSKIRRKSRRQSEKRK